MKKIIKYGITAFGVLWIIAYLIICTKSNLNLGNLLVLLLGVCIAAWCNLPQNRLVKWLKILFLAGGFVYFLIALFIFVQGSAAAVTYTEDAIVVLGCGVRGKIPSYDLRLRLDKAFEYYANNPQCVLCVCGGQGPQEDIAEAEAMRIYLTDKGVPENKIITEDKSTTTAENFKFAKNILDEHFGGSKYSIVYTTNNFHSFRAGLYAKDAGFNEIYAFPAPTNKYSIIQNYMREVLALCHKIVLE